MWLTTQTGKSVAGTLNAATLDEVTWGVWQEEETTTENETPGKLNADRDAVRAGVGAVLDCVVDTGCDEQTDGDAELVTGDEGTTDLARTDLRHVQNDHG